MRKLTDEERKFVGETVAECRTFDERQETREQLVGMLDCSHQAVSAASIWYNKQNHLPIDGDVDEWYEREEEYSGESKCGYRARIKEFLSRSFNRFRDLHVVCLPGVHCWEIEDYMDLGIQPKNIWGVERDKREFELMQYKANKYGINTWNSSLNKFFSMEEFADQHFFDIAVLDYKGQLCKQYLEDVTICPLVLPGVMITNCWCRREKSEIQQELDDIHRRLRASAIMDKVQGEHKMDFKFVDMEGLSGSLETAGIEDLRDAIAGIILKRVQTNLQDHRGYMEVMDKFCEWAIVNHDHDLFKYLIRAIPEQIKISMQSDQYTFFAFVNNLIHDATETVVRAAFGINQLDMFESFDYLSPSGSQFYTTMIKMIPCNYDPVWADFGSCLANVVDGKGAFVIQGNDLIHQPSGKRWTDGVFVRIIGQSALESSFLAQDLAGNQTHLNSIELTDADLEMAGSNQFIGNKPFQERRRKLEKNRRKKRRKQLERMKRKK